MDFSALRKFSWNEEIYLAQQGDTQAVRRTCATAEPIVDQFGKVSYFVGWLGKDEVRSIASLALVEFIMSYSGGVPDEEIPALIKQVIKCDLINSVHRMEYRRSKEDPRYRLARKQFRRYRLAFCAPLRGTGSLPVAERICPNGTGRDSAPEPE